MDDAGSFAEAVMAWQRLHGRHDLPWQGCRDPYRIWVSEIMLQQTQVGAVIPYYQRFMGRFPDVATLAAAPVDAVLEHWSGLGYYARARNLHRAANWIVSENAGVFPASAATLARLPGVGRSTAAAIAAFAFGERAAILDGNVKRVLTRCFGIAGWPGAPRVEAELWVLAERLLPQSDIGVYTQGLMDLGSGVCTRKKPRCGDCPLQPRCVAARDGSTASIPAPRPPRNLPRRETFMLVMIRGDEVMLAQRPSTGIWGGLWCFPEVSAEAAASPAAERRGVRVARIERLAAVEHGFTHFRLTIHPLLLEVVPARLDACEPGTVWMPLARAAQAAVPSPVRRMLERIAKTGGLFSPA
jgi:A/G-specific adenine glycosylase